LTYAIPSVKQENFCASTLKIVMDEKTVTETKNGKKVTVKKLVQSPTPTHTRLYEKETEGMKKLGSALSVMKYQSDDKVNNVSKCPVTQCKLMKPGCKLAYDG